MLFGALSTLLDSLLEGNRPYIQQHPTSCHDDRPTTSHLGQGSHHTLLVAVPRISFAHFRCGSAAATDGVNSA